LPINKWSKIIVQLGCVPVEYVGNIILISQDEEENDINIGTLKESQSFEGS